MSNEINAIDTPNLDKRKKSEKGYLIITNFLEFLEDENIMLCDIDSASLDSRQIKMIVDQYFGVNTHEADKELKKLFDI